LEKYQTHIALEQNLILTFGLLKRVSSGSITRLQICDKAKIGLENALKASANEDTTATDLFFNNDQFSRNQRSKQIIEYPSSSDDEDNSFHKVPSETDTSNTQPIPHIPLYDFDVPSIGCPFGFGRVKQRQQQTSNTIEHSSSEDEQLDGNEEENIESEDSEDSIDEYVTKLGFPQDKSKPGCPFIFHRLMIERRRMLQDQQNENNTDNHKENSVPSTDIQNLELHDKQETNKGEQVIDAEKIDVPQNLSNGEHKDIATCPYTSGILKTDNSNTSEVNLQELNGFSQEIKDEALKKCPHFKALQSAN